MGAADSAAAAAAAPPTRILLGIPTASVTLRASHHERSWVCLALRAAAAGGGGAAAATATAAAAALRVLLLTVGTAGVLLLRIRILLLLQLPRRHRSLQAHKCDYNLFTALTACSTARNVGSLVLSE